MYIPIDDTQNYPFCRLQLAADTHNSRKVPEVNNLTNKKTLIYNFGDYFNKQPNFPFHSAIYLTLCLTLAVLNLVMGCSFTNL